MLYFHVHIQTQDFNGCKYANYTELLIALPALSDHELPNMSIAYQQFHIFKTSLACSEVFY